MTTPPAPDDLLEGLRAGDRRSLAQSITLVESSLRSDEPARVDLLAASAPLSGGSRRIGISGTPGVGKSTLIEAMGIRLLDRGHRLAVLAVDPTSARTGGSILGDKTRMPQLAVDRRAFVRPSPAGDALGGIAGSTAAAVSLCEAAGYDIVLVETVGIGQSETAVADVTDLFLLLHSPGAGDELQGIKRGVMELADRVVVTKADGDLLPASTRAAAELRSALHLMRPRAGRSMAPVGLCSSVTGDGVEELIDGLLDQHRALTEAGEVERTRVAQRRLQFDQTLRHLATRSLRDNPTALRLQSDARSTLDQSDVSPAAAAFRVAVAMGIA